MLEEKIKLLENRGALLLKHIITKDRRKLIVIIFLLLLFYAISFIPYLNLLFSPLNVITIIVLSSIIIFKLPGKYALIIGLFLFIPAWIFMLVNNVTRAESLGNHIFVFLLCFVILSMKEIRENGKDNH